MSLITCPECGKQFSEFAKGCPVCGMPTEKIKVDKIVPNVSSEETSTKEDTKKHVTKENFMFSNGRWWKLIVSIIVFIGVNFLVIDSSLTTNFGGLLLIALAFCCGVGFVLFDGFGALMGLCGIFVFMMFHKLLPTVDFINSDKSHEKKYVCYFVARDPTGDHYFLTPTDDYICNRTGKKLFITTVGYGDFQYEPNTYTDIPISKFVKGYVTNYFDDEISKSARVKGHSSGTYKHYVNYYKL